MTIVHPDRVRFGTTTLRNTVGDKSIQVTIPIQVTQVYRPAEGISQALTTIDEKTCPIIQPDPIRLSTIHIAVGSKNIYVTITV